ncbi:unnamed protein product [Vitrella brassicaformis CCMP3155]|uniref:Prostaglandin E synthase 2 n=2 Tax=Vitrella brassicaformis TaxID=1169539 RepID=A0A0G4G6A2_VITBC|nr:unnamed protein product [Vitrella brassicaformis CCMP3155]|eukprot:CEM23983.1 unnamed protein product [Vitrella brassicaformis CCMP3155]
MKLFLLLLATVLLTVTLVCGYVPSTLPRGLRGSLRPTFTSPSSSYLRPSPLRMMDAAAQLPEVTLYQFQTCPFCSKVRAYLEYNQVPYTKVEVNPSNKKEIAFSDDYKKVPIAMINGEQVNDSAEIISRLQAVLGRTAENAGDPDEVSKYRTWVNEKLAKTLPPNIYRTIPEALTVTGRIADTGNYSPWESFYTRYIGGLAMFAVSKGLKKKMDITDERQALYDAANEFVDAVGDRQYLGGETPSTADIEVYGVLDSIREFDAWRDMMDNSRIKPWYERMDQVMKKTPQPIAA